MPDEGKRGPSQQFKEIRRGLSDDPILEAEGTNEKIAGNIQEKIGQVKKVVGK